MLVDIPGSIASSSIFNIISHCIVAYFEPKMFPNRT